jgi:hypothetical protein
MRWIERVPSRIVESPSAAMRLDAAADFLRQFPRQQPITIVAATRGAADDLARRIARERGATFGLARFSLTQCAARIAATRLAGRGSRRVPRSGRKLFRLVPRSRPPMKARSRTSDVSRAHPVSRAHSQTPSPICGWQASLPTASLEPMPSVPIWRTCCRAWNRSSTPRTALTALDSWKPRRRPWRTRHGSRAPLLLLDVPVETRAEEQFIHALIGTARVLFATLPSHDAPAARALGRAGGQLQMLRESSDNDLALLRAHVFADRAPDPRSLDGSLEFFSAPGEGRECVEIARRC